MALLPLDCIDAPLGGKLASEMAAGTVVLTLDGAIPVEFLNPGDRVITRAGVQILRNVTARTVADCPMIRVWQAGADEVLVSPGQAIWVRDWRAKALTGQDQAMITADRLVDGELIRRETVSSQQVVRLEFDSPAVFYAGHLELAAV